MSGRVRAGVEEQGFCYLSALQVSGGGAKPELELRNKNSATFLPFKIVTPGDKNHEPSKLNYYTFGAELMPLGVNSLSFH
jgi:hypothetical protein